MLFRNANLRELTGIAYGEPNYRSIISVLSSYSIGQVSVADMGQLFGDIRRLRIYGIHPSAPWGVALFKTEPVGLEAGHLRHVHVGNEQLLKFAINNFKGRDLGNKLLFRPVEAESLTISIRDANDDEIGAIEGDGGGGLQGDIEEGYTWDNVTGELIFEASAATPDHAIAEYIKQDLYPGAWVSDEMAAGQRYGDWEIAPEEWRYLAYYVREGLLNQLGATCIMERDVGRDSHIFFTGAPTEE